VKQIKPVSEARLS